MTAQAVIFLCGKDLPGRVGHRLVKESKEDSGYPAGISESSGNCENRHEGGI